MLTGQDLDDFRSDITHPATHDSPSPGSPLLDDRLLLKLTGGMPPGLMYKSIARWLQCFSLDTGKQQRLAGKMQGDFAQWSQYTQSLLRGQTPDQLRSHPQLSGERWQQWPYNLVAQWYLLVSEWRRDLVHDTKGLEDEYQRLVDFLSLQATTSLSPYNFPGTNPEIVGRTLQERGANLERGLRQAFDDLMANLRNESAKPEVFRPGVEVAITPGKVVHRNRLMELIQYAPTTQKVSSRPVLIVPPWIMKYYILDLSPHNSLIKYLVEQGHTVFVVSWHNPDGQDRDLTMDDYLELGIMGSLDAVRAIVPAQPVQTVGYCIGGTLLAVAAAGMARDGDERLHSVTLFAAQADFTEAGEIRLFINDEQLAALDTIMAEKGYLDSKNMGASFMYLRPEELVWSPLVHKYLHGEPLEQNDLMAWNSDGTRMPARMHSDYLRQLYRDNDLAEGRYRSRGQTVDLSAIKVPMFVVGTVQDHVAPWPSVYKIHHLVGSEDLTFLLTSGGHNAGIVCGPSHPRRRYQQLKRTPGTDPLSPAQWREAAPEYPGSWWPAWEQWLKQQGGSETVPPAMGAQAKGYPVLDDAPGTYVHEC